MAKEISEKNFEAFELDDDSLELVNGGMMNHPVDAYYCICDCKGNKLSTCEYGSCPFGHNR